jgi:hypothetical protein
LLATKYTAVEIIEIPDDEPLDKPQTLEQLLKLRNDHESKLKGLKEKLDRCMSRKTKAKRTFDEFHTDSLAKCDETDELAGQMRSAVREHRKRLKGE